MIKYPNDYIIKKVNRLGHQDNQKFFHIYCNKRDVDSWFTYSSFQDEDFFKSWDINNLQPLWAEKNHSKGNRYSSEVINASPCI